MKRETKDAIKQAIPKLILSLVVLLALFGLLYFLYRHFNLDRFSNKDELREYIASFGAWAPIVYTVIQFLQVTFVPIPASVTIIVGNLLFGPGYTFLYSYIGIMLGTVLAFWLGRWLGKPFVAWLAGGADKLEALLAKLKKKQNVVLFFMFLLPFFPDDLLCSVCGILDMSFLTFMLMQIPTRATSIGATLLFMSGEYIPWSGWGIPVLIIIGIAAIAAFVVSYIYSEKIEAFFLKIIYKISDKFSKDKDDSPKKQ